ncbi:hypothetical protein HP550_19335 [Cellulomonas humilata]|uniref:Uncharacterized protein n=1 Tax=Cellulomonas humilata TaxID=144055 RepID=A0A7Y6A444_9CELL|nr:hypothetical protein [Cellulomonas humilata]NUU19407.1 hypothetical protein [Cellulomonas humilata]
MHPELFAVLYEQRERELELELSRRFLLEERAPKPERTPKPVRSWRLPRLTFRAAPTVCCAAA